MLRSVDSLIGYRLLAIDGDLGKIRDLYFDDRAWGVRYFMVDTGGWLTGRRVLISPVDADAPDRITATLPVRLSKKQVEGSPAATEDRPVSRQFEAELSSYYGWPPYWSPSPAGVPAQTGVPAMDQAIKKAKEDEDNDPHLRSAREVVGYHIQAVDDEAGHVEDMVVDIGSWSVRYVVVDTRNWLPGRKVLVAPNWIDSVSWKDRKVRVDLTREEIKGSPEFNPEEPVNRQYETRLYDYYGRPAYWG